jgi:DNA-binding transcriptional LysR family regulator
MDRLATMRVFQTVADEGGFAAAARLLDMSPAGVTRLVADLEAHVGARLLQRTTRRVSLTEAGEAYLARVRQILSDVEEATAIAQAHTEELSGVLRLLASPVLSVHVLAPLIADFRRLHPRITVEIHVDVLQAPAVSDYDITLMGVEESFDANVIARPITTTEAILCASPVYLQKKGIPQLPEDLVRHDCLVLRTPDRRPGLMRLMHSAPAGQVVEVPVQPVLLVNHIETLQRAALDGAGICGQPLSLVAPYLRDGSLVRVLSPWILGRYTTYAALPSRKFMPARTRAFMEFLSARAAAMVQEAMEVGQTCGELKT